MQKKTVCPLFARYNKPRSTRRHIWSWSVWATVGSHYSALEPVKESRKLPLKSHPRALLCQQLKLARPIWTGYDRSFGGQGNSRIWLKSSHEFLPGPRTLGERFSWQSIEKRESCDLSLCERSHERIRERSYELSARIMSTRHYFFPWIPLAFLLTPMFWHSSGKAVGNEKHCCLS